MKEVQNKTIESKEGIFNNSTILSGMFNGVFIQQTTPTL
jgi:hypothetical protein